MDYPIHSPGQLSIHLRAVRKARRLSQVQLGAVLGVGQTRIARIERDPTAVGVAQLLDLLNALGLQMVLRSTGSRVDTGRAQGVAQAASTRGASAKRRAADEPW